ncbi:MAG: hypothetical protein CSA72_04240 [Rhodobacterales bacterium]|nr:MAG: hypothetical protein CSA72_04240 [Rhodobacterales bacterium]
MFAFLRFAVPLLIALSVLFLAVSLWSRFRRARKLRAQWAQDPQGDRDDFVREGLRDYDDSLRAKLIWGVYIVPICVIAVMVYAANFL